MAVKVNDGAEPVVRSRSSTTTVLGVFLVLVGGLWAIITSSLAVPGQIRVAKEGLTFATAPGLIFGYVVPFIGWTLLVSGFGILARKNWARLSALVISGLFAMLLLVMIIVGLTVLLLRRQSPDIRFLVIVGPLCWSYAYTFLYFRRPGVKAQFQKSG